MSLIRHFHHPVVSLHHPVVSGGIVLKDRLSAPPRLNVSLPQLVAFAQFVIASHLHAASSFRFDVKYSVYNIGPIIVGADQIGVDSCRPNREHYRRLFRA